MFCFLDSEYFKIFTNKFLDNVIKLIEKNENIQIPKDLIDFLPEKVKPIDYIKKYINEKIRPMIDLASSIIPNIFNLFVQILLFASI